MNKIFRKYIALVVLGLSISSSGVLFSYTSSGCNALENSETSCEVLVANTFPPFTAIEYALIAEPYATTPTISTNIVSKTTFMTFNIRLDGTYAGIIDMIEDESPDILGLQEVSSGSALVYYNEGLEDDYYMYIEDTTSTSSGSAEERLAIFFKKDRFNLLDGGSWWLSYVSSTANLDEDMGASWVVLQDKLNGDEYFVVNAHFAVEGEYIDDDGAQCLCDFKSKEEVREINVTKVMANVASEYGGRKVVILGDMNAEPDATELEGFFDHSNPDLRLSINSHPTSSANSNAFYIDHIYFNRDLFQVYSKVVETYDYSASSDIGCKFINPTNECNDVSDHFPVYGEMVTSEYMLPRIIPVMSFMLH